VLWAHSSTNSGIYADSTSGSGVYGRGGSYGVYGYGNSGDFYAAHTGTYLPFTGSHDVLLSPADIDLKPGMIVSVTGKTHQRIVDGEVSLSMTLPEVKASDKPMDQEVIGVFSKKYTTAAAAGHWYQGPGQLAIVNALGEGRVWVTDINGNITPGDYITTSAVAGYGQKQDDDLLHSYTLGKATENVEWDKVKDEVEYQGKKHKAYLIAVVYTSG